MTPAAPGARTTPPAPMLAKPVATVPEQDAVEGGYLYEPKWDGFRGVVQRTDEGIVIGSRGSKTLERYFPELVAAFDAQLPGTWTIDGEIVVRRGEPGRERLDWDALSQRIHPAASRIRLLSESTPAEFIAFDALVIGGESLLEAPFRERREALEELLAGASAPLRLSRTSDDADVARRWFVQFEGAGLDGVIAKPRDAAYAPNKRVMLKVKHHRTADVVAIGYRVHASGAGVGSLLLGLYDDAGVLHQVGGVSAFSDVRRRELVDELDPVVERDAGGEPVRREGERSRFSGSKDVSFVVLRPERVLEVRYDQMEVDRFRHTVQFERWRDDREPRSCTYEQLEVPAAYDFGGVLVAAD